MISAFLCQIAQSAPPKTRPPATLIEQQQNQIEYIYPTKFGDLKFLKEDGSLGAQAKIITLNDKELINSSSRTDGYGFRQRLIAGDFIIGSGVESLPKKLKNSEGIIIKRLIALEGEDGNCIRQLIILDFTGTKPFVSERFGYNPEGKACLKFKRAKWGVKESYIYFEGPMKYVYYTNGKVIGPIN